MKPRFRIVWSVWDEAGNALTDLCRLEPLNEAARDLWLANHIDWLQFKHSMRWL